MNELVHHAQQLHSRYHHGARDGYVETDIDGVHFFWAHEEIGCYHRIYETGIAILFQGRKVGHLDGRQLHYGPDDYLVMSVPIALEWVEVISPTEPMLGIFVSIDVPQLRGIATLAGRHGLQHDEASDTALRLGIEPIRLDDSMRESTLRLLKALCSPLDSAVLGPDLVKEMIYRAFLGPHGPTLQALTEQDANVARIARSLDRIRQEFASGLTVQELADEAAMSTSAFHRAFKQVTGNSPLQYIKKIRLHRAQELITLENARIGDAALEVGYESPTQFSREFKRYFNVTPSQARKLGPDYPLLEAPS